MPQRLDVRIRNLLTMRFAKGKSDYGQALADAISARSPIEGSEAWYQGGAIYIDVKLASYMFGAVGHWIGVKDKKALWHEGWAHPVLGPVWYPPTPAHPDLMESAMSDPSVQEVLESLDIFPNMKRGKVYKG